MERKQREKLGVAHPPGYPLWTMLSYVFVRVLDFVPGLPEPTCETCSFPIERNVAWRVNLSSAVYADDKLLCLCSRRHEY